MFRRKTIPHPKPESIPTSAQVDKGLEVIYGNENGAETDFSKLEMRKTKTGQRLLIWILLTLLVLSGAAYGGYRVFQRAVSGNGETLRLTIDGPSEVISGQEVAYDVSYENTGTIPLASLEVKLNVPKGFLIENADPTATTENTIWTIGAITAGSDGLITLKGIWIDPVPSGQTLQALATYRPANFNADFEKITTKAIAVKASTLTLASEGPKTGTGGSTADYTFTIKNTGTRAVEGARVRLTIPTAFIVSAVDPAPMEGGSSEWQLANLEPGAEATVKVSGQFTADGSGLVAVSGSLGVMRDQDYLQQAVSEVQTDVVGGGLSVRFISNGSTTDQTADPGSTLRLSIDVDNGSDQDVGGLSVMLTASSESKTSPIDWTKANLVDGTLSVNTVTWDSETLSKEGHLNGGERETIDLALPLLATLGTASDVLTLSVTVTVSDVGGVATTRSLQSTPLTININSDLGFTTDARYFQEGTPVGSGPLPPTVGQTTRYRLRWQINNTVHALDALTVSATIPPGVTYVGSITNDMGIVSFDQTSRLLSWTIDRLPTTVTSVATSFDLSVTPTAEDLGTFVKLLNSSTLVATDSKTSDRLENRDEAITTEIPNDTDAVSKGAVVE